MVNNVHVINGHVINRHVVNVYLFDVCLVLMAFCVSGLHAHNYLHSYVL